MALSARRVAAVKAFLVAHGISEDKITVEPMGITQILDAATVSGLEAENPFKSAEIAKGEKLRAIRLAYNRRSDIEVQPANLQTSRFFPHSAAEADVLLKSTWPKLKTVVNAQQPPSAVTARVGARP